MVTGKTAKEKKNERTETDNSQELKNCTQHENTQNSINCLLTTNDLTKKKLKRRKPHFKIMFKQHINLTRTEENYLVRKKKDERAGIDRSKEKLKQG